MQVLKSNIKFCRICCKSMSPALFKNMQYVCNKCREDKEQQNKIRSNVSTSIHKKLYNYGSFSINNYLPYSMQDLRKHLESQFEYWMNWSNYGTYRVDSWNDNDPKTWTWQIDHIIPQSWFCYITPSDPGFQSCWALDNLRPLSSKRNNKESARHYVIY